MRRLRRGRSDRPRIRPSRSIDEAGFDLATNESCNLGCSPTGNRAMRCALREWPPTSDGRAVRLVEDPGGLGLECRLHAGVAQLVERLLPKQKVREFETRLPLRIQIRATPAYAA